MQSSPGAERRHAPRVDLTTFCPAIFMLYGIEHHALMVNLSETGARFRVEEHTQHLNMEIGDPVMVTIKTPYGAAMRKGAVQWIREMGGFLTWGLEFFTQPEEETDPLRSLLDSSF
jgi:hypothetical protein